MTNEHLTLLSTLLTPGGIIALFIQKWWAERAIKQRAKELRQQTIADSGLKAAETQRLAAELALANQRALDRAADIARFQHQSVVAKIDENTALTGETKAVAIEAKEEAHAAFEVGNHVNMKLETIGVEMKDGKPLNEEKAPANG